MLPSNPLIIKFLSKFSKFFLHDKTEDVEVNHIAGIYKPLCGERNVFTDRIDFLDVCNYLQWIMRLG